MGGGYAPTLLATTGLDDEHSIKVAVNEIQGLSDQSKGSELCSASCKGQFSRINPDIACTITTHMNEWIGNFISPDIEKVIRNDAKLGSEEPTIIYGTDGTIIKYDGKEYRMECKQAGELHGPYDKMFEQSRRVYDPEGASPTLHTTGGGNQEQKIIEEPQCMRLERTEEGRAMRREKDDNAMSFKEGKELTPRDDGLLNTLTTKDKDNYIEMPIKSAVKAGYEEAYPRDSIDLVYPNSETRRGKVGEQVAQTLQTGGGNQLGVTMPNYRIRKLTEKECFRLMGVKDDDSENIGKHQSKSSCFHLAGDSIVTTCLMGIFGEMFDIDYESKIREVEQEICSESQA